MKKLMTMIAAVATAFGLFADETVVSNSTDFSALAVDSLLNVAKDDDGRTSEKPSYWTYSASEVAADALLIGGDASSKYLAIKTGSETIYRNFAGQESGRQNITSFGAATEVKDEGLYIDTTLKFLAPLDEIPVAAADTKLVMGLVEETELEITGLTAAGTNLWVIGGYGTAGTAKRAYRMAIYNPNTLQPETIDNEWLQADKRVVVKAYNKVANTDLPGFVVNIDGMFCTVVGSAPITDGVIGTYETAPADYLGLGTTPSGRYGKKQVILSLDGTAALTAAGFSGKADMSEIYLGNIIPAGMEEAFVESVEMTVTVGEGVATATATVAGGSAQPLNAGANTVVFAPGESITVAATPAEKKILMWAKNGESVEAEGSYTYAFTAGDELTVSAVNSAATAYGVSGEPIGSYATLADAIDAEGVVKVILDNDTALEEELYIEKDGELTIDLHGNTISGVATTPGAAIIQVAAGSVVITDSEGDGEITPDDGYTAVDATGVLTFDGDEDFNVNGAVTKNGEATEDTHIYIKAGRFLASANESLAGIAEFDDDKTLVPDGETGYLIVGIPAPTTFTVTVNASNATLFTNGEAVVDAQFTAEKDTVFTLTATPAEGYKNPTIKIAGKDVTSLTVADNVTIDVAATQIQYWTVTIDTVANCTIAVTNGETEVKSNDTFDQDDTTTLKVYRVPAAGYKLVNCEPYEEITLSSDTNITAAVEEDAQPVNPEEPIPAKADDINKNIGAYLKVPIGVTDAGAYLELFHAVDNGDGTASIVLTTAAEAAIKGELNTAAVETSILTPDEDGNATLKTKPGLFYGIAAADNLTLGSEQVAKDGWTMATGAELKVKVPPVTGDKAFFKPVCSAVAK